MGAIQPTQLWGPRLLLFTLSQSEGTRNCCAQERVKGEAGGATRSASSMTSSVCMSWMSLCVKEADTSHVGSHIGNWAG